MLMERNCGVICRKEFSNPDEQISPLGWYKIATVEEIDTEQKEQQLSVNGNY